MFENKSKISVTGESAFLEKCINVYVSRKIDQNVEFFKTFILLQ